MSRTAIRRTLRTSTLVATACASLQLGLSVQAGAQERSLQLALLNPVQIRSEDQAIRGVRLSLLYGKNTDVTGLDLSLVASHVTGDFEGVQIGLVGVNEANSSGWQWNGVNINGGDFYGLQTGLYNQTLTGRGVQLGWVNNSKGEYRGLQLSIVNYAQRLDGVQIGLINIISEGGQFPFFPIVNWGKN
jgi:hypothetical protein